MKVIIDKKIYEAEGFSLVEYEGCKILILSHGYNHDREFFCLKLEKGRFLKIEKNGDLKEKGTTDLDIKKINSDFFNFKNIQKIKEMSGFKKIKILNFNEENGVENYIEIKDNGSEVCLSISEFVELLLKKENIQEELFVEDFLYSDLKELEEK